VKLEGCSIWAVGGRRGGSSCGRRAAVPMEGAAVDVELQDRLGLFIAIGGKDEHLRGGKSASPSSLRQGWLSSGGRRHGTMQGRSDGVACAQGARQRRFSGGGGLCATRGAARGSWRAGKPAAVAKRWRHQRPCFFSRQRKKKEIPRVVLKFPNFLGG
jgi:hypothetical protein